MSEPFIGEPNPPADGPDPDPLEAPNDASPGDLPPGTPAQDPDPDTVEAGSDATPVDLPPDPLLQSGTYIDAEDRNGDAEVTPEKGQREAEATIPAASAPSETPPTQRRQKRTTETAAERPSWLPENWGMEVRVRASGATSGSFDRYYIEPVAGRKFRSKNEVMHFLETGSRLKRKANADAAESSPSESPSPASKQKKSGQKSKKSSMFVYDFENAPESISWTLTDTTQDKWTPTGTDGVVLESTKQQWSTVFSDVTQQVGNHLLSKKAYF